MSDSVLALIFSWAAAHPEPVVITVFSYILLTKLRALHTDLVRAIREELGKIATPLSEAVVQLVNLVRQGDRR